MSVGYTDNFGCIPQSPAQKNIWVRNTGTIVSVSINTPDNPFCQGSTVTFTTTPINGGATPSYQWQVNGIGVGLNNPVYSYIPSNGDLVTCVMNSSINCPTGNPATSNTITMVENTNSPVSVSINATANPVCSGTSCDVPVQPPSMAAQRLCTNGR